ncbi:hypothetical protein [Cupriavidus sp. L7L]|uniref:hypothetical protein n=1 Tax=Cupriavidus sp. L7L TaxID=2546443 RepID=UPI001FB60C28|nr:hypothetical protein [Cupriavidus sp. L7L]
MHNSLANSPDRAGDPIVGSTLAFLDELGGLGTERWIRSRLAGPSSSSLSPSELESIEARMDPALLFHIKQYSELFRDESQGPLFALVARGACRCQHRTAHVHRTMSLN